MSGAEFPGSDLVELLRWRAATDPEDTAFTFLADGENEESSCSYQQLDLGARSIAAQLQERTSRGDRILLLFPIGLAYIAAYFGCLYANVIAVPAYPPRTRKALPKLESLVVDAGARLALTSSELANRFRDTLDPDSRLAGLHWLAPVPAHETIAAGWQCPNVSAGDIAFLQYTSGSTSAPRGVMVSHHNLLSNQRMIRRSFDHDVSTTAVSWLPLYHDMGLIGSVIQPLFVGSRCIFMPPMAFIQQPVRWLAAISRYRATSSGGPNFGYELCLDRISDQQLADLDLSCWSLAFNGAEPVRATTMERFSKRFAGCGFDSKAFFPCYGLAEATLLVSGGRRGGGAHSETFDRPALEQGRAVRSPDPGATTLVASGSFDPELDARIVDPDTAQPCADGDVGEIWVAGDSVAQGYWGNPESGAGTFGARIGNDDRSYLRTGDLGFVYDHRLFITGRLKDLIVIAGRNIYPQDVELTVEHAHPALRAGGSAAFSIEADGDEKLVVAQEVERQAIRGLDREQIFTRIRAAIQQAHEVAVHGIVLLKPGSLPKTSSGKIQRHAVRRDYLQEAFKSIAAWRQAEHQRFSAPSPVSEYGAGAMPPRNPVENALADIWREVLQVDSIGVHDNLLEWGAQSLQATQISLRIHTTLQIDVPLAILLEHATIAELAAWIADHQADRTASAPRPLTPTGTNTPPALTWSQERMWFIHQMQPDSAAYNLVLGMRFSGPMDVDSLQRALDFMVERHQPLRTAIKTMAGVPVVEIAASGRWPFETIDLGGEPPESREQLMHAQATHRASKPYDLASGSLLSAQLYRYQDQRHVLILNMHHAIADAWSFGVIARELGALYESCFRGLPDPLPPLQIQYADFAAWQRACFDDVELQRQMSYWKQQLAGVPVLALPTDHPRPAVQGHHGRFISEIPDPELLDRVRAFSQRHGVTPFMTILAAFLAVLNRYSGQGDIAVGTPVANRHHIASESLIGTFVNTLVMRNQLADDPTFGELLTRVRDTALAAYSHQDLPFEQLVAELQPTRDLSHAPLFQIMVDYVNIPAPDNQVGNMVWSLVDIDRNASQFDLTLMVIDTLPAQRISIEYNTELFDQATIRRLLRQLQELLADAVTHAGHTVSKLRILPATERERLLRGWNSTETPANLNICLHQAIADQVRRTPDAVAAVYDGTLLSYADLDRQSSRLCAYLRGQGVESGHRVGICLHRSLDMLIALVGILKSGAAYVPLDPAFPRERLQYMLEDCGAQALVTDTRLSHWLLDSMKNTPPLVLLDSDAVAIQAADTERFPVQYPDARELAYIIYTSGSTGAPKGVQIPHRAVINFLNSMRHTPGLEAGDTLLSVTTLSFDIAVLELYLPLTIGARVELVGREIAYDGKRLALRIAESGATVMQATPATWRMLLDSGWQGSTDLKVLCGGEALPRDLVQRLLPVVGSLWNMYGPTETTVWSATGRITDANDPISVGRPIDNTRIYVLDAHLQPVPTGAIGELWIAGEGLARGYLGRPQLTAEKFVTDPHSPHADARMYATGDLARHLDDGRLEVLGRKDFQVKIRGFRIELGEIETALNDLPGVRQAVVVTVDDHSGLKRLIAYIALDHDLEEPPDTATLRKSLLEKLPDYMVPSRFLFLESLPLTPNGKIDRLALPSQDTLASIESSELVAPRTPFEQAIADIFVELLELKQIGIHDDFFVLGGHSLIATRVISRIHTSLQVELPLRALFENPTVESLALLASETRVRSSDDDTMEALIAEIGNLSDEEVQDLLEREQK